MTAVVIRETIPRLTASISNRDLVGGAGAAVGDAVDEVVPPVVVVIGAIVGFGVVVLGICFFLHFSNNFFMREFPPLVSPGQAHIVSS